MKRSINWLDQTTRALKSRHRETAGCAEYITRRLANLLLERLPAQTAGDLVAILPAMEREFLDTLRSSAEGPAESSIGYTQFVNRAAFAIGCSGAIACPADRAEFEADLQSLAQQVTDTFFWSIAHEFSEELKARLARELPNEIRSHMDLYGEDRRVGDTQKVA